MYIMLMFGFGPFAMKQLSHMGLSLTVTIIQIMMIGLNIFTHFYVNSVDRITFMCNLSVKKLTIFC